MGRLNNLIFNLQFQIPSRLKSVLKFSISDFAFLRAHTLICWEEFFFPPKQSRTPWVGVADPQGSADHRLRTAALDY
jgi:hypothetical protein